MNICIIGGGATGLTSGYELVKKGHKVTVYECESGCGGLVSTIKAGELPVERFYHHIFNSDTDLIDLIHELGLSSKLIWKEPKNGIYINERLYPFTSPLDLLLFKELSLPGRISMGLLVLKAKFLKDWKALESMSAKDWIIKNAVKDVYEKVWGPLLYSKFDADADNVSAVWIWNKFKLRGSTRGKNLSREELGYMDGSFGIVYRTLIDKIIEKGSKVVYPVRVNKILPLENKTLDVITEDGSENFDRVLVTAAPSVLKEMGLTFPSWYGNKLEGIKYKSNICMLLKLKQSLSPYYWITVAQKDAPFVLAIEHTRLIPDQRYESHLVYLSRYLDDSDELFAAGSEQIEEVFLDYLKKLFPSFDKGQISGLHISKAKFAQPVVSQNYSGVIPEFKTPVENLYLACMAQIYPEDRGQNYAVRMGRNIAEIIGKHN